MALELFPNEGLDQLLNIAIRGTVSQQANWYVGLWYATPASPTAVPITKSQTMANVLEIQTPGSNGYTRQAISASSFGVPGDTANGRSTVGPQVTFTATGGNWGRADGFFISDQSSGGKIIAISCFSDQTSVTVNQNDVLKVTPTIEFQQ